MDKELMSEVKQLRAASLDQKIDEYRDELHIWGALEAWLSHEGVSTWSEDQFTYQDGGASFSFKSGYWMALVVKSLNFPEVLKLVLSLDLVAIDVEDLQIAQDLIYRLNTPHFFLSLNQHQDEYIISMTCMISSEPKNYQLAIGVAINDILTGVESVTQHFLSMETARTLLNY